MADVKNYPIFAVGKWNGMEFSEADLDDMAQNYALLAGTHRVPLKLGHRNAQPGQPALGWIANVRRIGKELVADFTDVPKAMLEAIKKRLYRSVSIELLMGVQYKGKTLRNVLDAVAILGADQPAVSILPDLDKYLAERSTVFDSAGRRVEVEAIAGNQVSRDKVLKALIPLMVENEWRKK